MVLQCSKLPEKFQRSGKLRAQGQQQGRVSKRHGEYLRIKSISLKYEIVISSQKFSLCDYFCRSAIWCIRGQRHSDTTLIQLIRDEIDLTLQIALFQSYSVSLVSYSCVVV